MKLSQVNLVDPDNFVNGGKHWEMFDLLRREAPVYWHPEPHPATGFWAITRYADVCLVDRDVHTFSSAKTGVHMEDLDARQLRFRRSMIETDGPRHQALRRLLQPDFTASAIQGQAESLRALVKKTLDEVPLDATIDCVSAISNYIPLRILTQLLGVPSTDMGILLTWTNQMFGATDPAHAQPISCPSERDRRYLPYGSPAAREAIAYGRALAEQRHGGDGHDLISKLVHQMPEDGQPLTPIEYDNYFILLLSSGHETTRHTITHIIRAFAEQPELLRRLRTDRQLIPIAVEELLRWSSPVYYFRRTATRDVEMHGTRIRAGDKVIMWLASANHDPAAFAAPDRIVLDRPSCHHVSFGRGSPHNCLGAALARCELQIFIEELVSRISAVQIFGKIAKPRSNFINGIKSMSVALYS
jgi:cytochrome P450